jgi:hypothetical protein
VATGRMVHGRLLPHIVRQCGVCPGAASVVVAVGKPCGSRQCPVTMIITVGDGVLDVPCWVCRCMLRQTTAPYYVGAVGGVRLPPRVARRDTRIWVLPQQCRTHTRLTQNHTGDHRGTRWSVRTPRGNRRRTYLSHNTAQARCGKPQSSPVGTRRQFAVTLSLARVVPPRDRLRPCVRRSGSVRRDHRNTSRGKAQSQLLPRQFPYKKKIASSKEVAPFWLLFPAKRKK